MKRALRHFGRALLLRCPNCGGGGIFRNWLSIREYCPKCGLWLERQEGFYTGAIAMNLVTSEFAFILCFIAAVLLTWPDPPWGVLQIAAVVMMIIFPILFFPFSKTLWLAFDLTVRPVTRSELSSVYGPAPEEEEPVASAKK
jgi:uncharacterized protein (DUF983 family)